MKSEISAIIQIWNRLCNCLVWWKCSFGHEFKIKLNCCRWYSKKVDVSLFNKKPYGFHFEFFSIIKYSISSCRFLDLLMKTKLVLRMLLIVIILKIELIFNQIMTQKLSFKCYWIFLTSPLTFRCRKTYGVRFSTASWF